MSALRIDIFLYDVNGECVHTAGPLLLSSSARAGFTLHRHGRMMPVPPQLQLGDVLVEHTGAATDYPKESLIIGLVCYENARLVRPSNLTSAHLNCILSLCATPETIVNLYLKNKYNTLYNYASFTTRTLLLDSLFRHIDRGHKLVVH